MFQTVNAVPKPSHGRNKPLRRNHTAITQKVRNECDRRSMEVWGTNIPCCERCGALEYTAAHIQAASQYGSGGVPWNIINLCGTHGTKGCHDWADNTAAGRKYMKQKAIELKKYYESGNGRMYWAYKEE